MNALPCKRSLGSVGDVDHGNHEGRIGLVDGKKDQVFAKKKRFYQ
jgi:hypothetical protein